jgi:photosystem II stability/assembly factor-like uncharacterized protein
MKISAFLSPLKVAAVTGLIVGGAIVSAQQWRQVTTFPTYSNLNASAFTSATRGVVVGEYGAFYATADAGVSWQKAAVTPASSLNAIFWLDQQRGWVVGSAGPDDAFRTTDGGQTWTKMTGLPHGSHYSVTFLTASFGYTVFNGGSAITRNGGTTWSDYPYNAVMFKDDQVGLAWDDQGILRTTNGGLAWTRVLSAPSVIPLWVSSTVCVAMGSGGIYRSTTAGQSWTKVSTIDRYYSSAALSANTIVGWNNVGDVVRSADGGLTWSETVGQCPEGILWAVRVNDNTICGVSASGDVYRSTNGGATWSRTQDGLGEGPVLWDIHFTDSQHGWVVGQNGIILRSTDGGASWRLVTRGVGFEVDSIKMPDEDTLMGAGGLGLFIKSVDGGATFKATRLKVTGQVFNRDETVENMVYHPNGLVICVGFGGVIYRSTDMGDTWTSVGYPVISDQINLWALQIASDGQTVYAAGEDGSWQRDRTFWKSTDGGQTWTNVHRFLGKWVDISVTDANHIWGITHDRRLRRSTDGGLTWTSQAFIPADTFADTIEMVDNQVGYVAGWFGFFGKTTDGGATWTQRRLEAGMNFLDIKISPTGELVMVGRDDLWRVRVWRSTDGGDTWSSQQVSNWPNGLHRVGFSPSGKIALAGFRGQILEQLQTIHQVAPTAFEIDSGSYSGGDVSSLLSSDNDYLTVITTHFSLPVIVRFEATSPTASAGAITFHYEGHVTNPSCVQNLELYDYVAGAWVLVNSRAGSLSDITVTLPLTNPTRFIQTGTRKVEARLAISNSARNVRSWIARVDHVRWSIQP